MMLSIIIFISLFTISFSSKLGQPKDDLEDEQTILLTKSITIRKLQENNEFLAANTDIQLSADISNLIDAKILDSVKTYDDYIRLRDRYRNFITQQRVIINQINTVLPNYKAKLSTDEAELLAVEYKLDTLKNESTALSTNLGNLERLRDYERQGFISKLKESRALIIGLDRTEENMREMAQGDETLNQNAVQHILDLMKGTMQSLEDTMKHDIQTERQADRNYRNFVQKSSQQLRQDKFDNEKLSERKSDLLTEIDDLKDHIKAATFRKNQAEVVMSQAITDLDELNKKFAVEK